MKQRVVSLAALVCNALAFVFSVFAISQFFVGTGDSFMSVDGLICFRYFTIDSNVLCSITCLAALPACIRGLRGRHFTLSRPVLLARFTGTAAVSVTMLTVIFFLGPTMGYANMFTGPSLWLHGVNPILAILCFGLLEGQSNVRFRDAWLAIIPVAVYAAVYLPMVVLTQTWPDFYGFNRGGLWYVSGPVMLIAAYVIGLLLIGLQQIRPLQKALHD